MTTTQNEPPQTATRLNIMNDFCEQLKVIYCIITPLQQLEQQPNVR